MRLCFGTLALCWLLLMTASLKAAEPQMLRLWEGDAPGASGSEEKDVPTATVYLPDSAAAPSGAIVIFPGGGYGHLAMDHEGQQIAQWANKMGLAGVVVSYRHRGRGYGHPAPMLDAQRAIRLTRHHAQEWNIDPAKIGVLGFSAGGHLTTTVLTHFDAGDASAADPIDRLSCRPDFGVVCYAVVAFGEDITHKGSQRNLLGEDASPELIRSLSNEKQVTAQTPPCFVWHTAEDKGVPAENSLRFYSALLKAGVPSELHIFPLGRHGIGLAADFPGASQWPALCHDWLRRGGIAR
ncbi:MAG: alpha/beta hydrolase [Planctomycetales bacterium]|nr:alpha/beta hydrolase [Planctomycetales bacterium]